MINKQQILSMDEHTSSVPALRDNAPARASPPSAASAFPREYIPDTIRQRGVRITAAQEQSVRAQSTTQRRHQRGHCAPGAGSSA